jgi:hypothetical protein
MEVLRFEEYINLVNELNEYDGDKAIEIDLDDPESKIELDKKYSFLGVEFTPSYRIPIDKNSEPYSAIIRKPGIKDGREQYWGKVIHAVDLQELQNEIRVEIKFYIEDEKMKTENITSET